MSLFSELRRRNVIRAMSAYVVIAWLLLQLASIVVPTFLAPPWVMQAITVMLAAGLPVVVLLSWLFNLTARGLVRDQGSGAAPASPAFSGRIVDAVIIGMLLVAVGLFAYNEFVIEKRATANLRIRPAVAVLPFTVAGNDLDDRIFADGVATELIARLSSWPNLQVLARAASFSTDLGDDIFATGRKLDARYLVTGDLQTSDGRLRLHMNVTDSTDGQTIWMERFDRGIGDLFELEEAISGAIVARIQPALLARESERAKRADPASLDAWEAAHRGWWYVSTETEDGYAEASQWFERAIALDPNWGWPYAAKGLAIYRSFLNGWQSRTDTAKRELMDYAEKAVRLDPMDAFAHHALGHAFGVVDRNEESLRALARGVQLNPNDAMAQACYGMQLAAQNRPRESIEAVEVAMSLSPDDPWMYWYTLVLARAYFAMGDYERSEEWAIRSNQIRPNFPAFLHSVSAAAHAGRIDVARQRVVDARTFRNLPPVDTLEVSFLAHTERSYTIRLMDGLRLADFDGEGPGTLSTP